jgi:hypothetical protein
MVMLFMKAGDKCFDTTLRYTKSYIIGRIQLMNYDVVVRSLIRLVRSSHAAYTYALYPV